ncbi:MAG: hypothetical protein HY884_06415 [Deltaproteobacteria bacterium]|nr:hypothetical protein [Deltaproteobacteria bacterium]
MFVIKKKDMNLLRGTSTILDIGATLRKPVIFIDNDVKALKSDWEAVGGDLWFAINKFKEEQEKGDETDGR